MINPVFGTVKTFLGPLNGLTTESANSITKALRQAMHLPLEGWGIALQRHLQNVGDDRIRFTLFSHEEYSGISTQQLHAHLAKVVPGLEWSSSYVLFTKDQLIKLCEELSNGNIHPLDQQNSNTYDVSIRR